MTTTRRFLRSTFVDLLVGPHGIDRYLELINPRLTVNDARAKVLRVTRQTPRSVTLIVRPNAVFDGFKAGQFLRVGVEIDGVRRTRTYSPASSEHRADGTLELTITIHPEGLVSSDLCTKVVPGSTLHLGAAQGDFVLPERRPDRLVLVSGGSGVTPVMSMLRTLSDEFHAGDVAFLHYARTTADWLYRSEVEALASRNPNVRAAYRATREGDGHFSKGHLTNLIGDLGDATVAVCGPPTLIDAVKDICPGDVLAESFTPPSLNLNSGTATGTLHFLRSDQTAPINPGSLLEQAEAVGLSPEFGCRMGICHTCTCRKTAGAVRNVLTDEVSQEEDEDIQLCVSVPLGDVALQI